MINRFFLKPLSFYLFCSLLGLVTFQACASRSVVLVHPQSGATVRCGAAGVGIMASGADSFVEECLSKYESQGYLAVEKLTPEQRADLENRGVLPKPEPPTFRMGY